MEENLSKTLLLLSVTGRIRRGILKRYILQKLKNEARVSEKIRQWIQSKYIDSELTNGKNRIYFLNSKAHMYLKNILPGYDSKVALENKFQSESLDGVFASLMNTPSFFIIYPKQLFNEGTFDAVIIYNSISNDPNKRVALYVEYVPVNTTVYQFEKSLLESEMFISNMIPELLITAGVVKTKFLFVFQDDKQLQNYRMHVKNSAVLLGEENYVLDHPFEQNYFSNVEDSKKLF